MLVIPPIAPENGANFRAEFIPSYHRLLRAERERLAKEN